ncbi:MAG: zf-HC2 domain-containing protein [Kofleriaceae bacterium]|nr:zf-HC2 domain-containing protein [Kofleriaceae bacterium]MBP9170484.1 zf-HC2 domain-containing protein [Kofleriaceae bacterium]MBP9859538.1 zf-HC2 domain-containing protein [Kofleriaceae bacterium]
MGTRLDIDALLVGALYGELDGDDRARLDAHLASHPDDRAALDGLRATRAFLVDHRARELLGAAEPPGAISARLLQEAARRAPVRRAPNGLWAFLAGLLRPIAAHPALSAAAVAMLVVGVGTIMTRDGRLEVAQPQVNQPQVNQPQVDQPGAPRAEAAVAPAPTAGAAPAADPAPEAVNEGLAVSLDDVAVARADADRARAGAATGGSTEKALGATTGGGKPLSRPTKEARKGAPRDPAFLEVDKKDLGSDLAMREEDEGYQGTGQGGAPVGGATSTTSLSLADGEAVGDSVAPAATARPVAPAPDRGAATAPPPPPANEAWARDQHARMVRLVNDGRCTEAGQIGAEIARKAPDYYQSAIANDRALRSCKAYVEQARRAKAPAPKAKNDAPADSERAK